MISIVIPAYNEDKTIEQVVRDWNGFFKNPEFIVINDASTDETTWILDCLGDLVHFDVHHYRNEQNLGHAQSLIKGLGLAGGDYVLYTDADNQIRSDSVDFDIISGYRTHRQDKLFRKIVSFILKMTIFLRHGYVIKDANCPFKVIKRSSLTRLLKRLPKDCIVPSICLEILARKADMKCIEIPVEHFPYKNRTGSLQSINKKSLTMFWRSFLEVIRL